jgi:hypothetical protein
MKWRIVDGSGGVHEVAATSNNGGMPWSAAVPEVTRRSYVGERDAVVLVAHAMGWGIAEVLASGEPTRAELLAENAAQRAAVREYLDAQEALDRAKSAQAIGGTLGDYALAAARKALVAYDRFFAAKAALAALAGVAT